MEHENCIGESSEWYTPPWIFSKLNVRFDVDVCSPGEYHWVPADSVITKSNGCLETDWGDDSWVFMNPPFEGRRGHVKYLEKFMAHPGGGLAICRAYTSADWFHEVAIKADGLFFPKGKTKFIRPDGSVGSAPGGGVVFLCMGHRACRLMEQQDWGWFVNQLGIIQKSSLDVKITQEHVPFLYQPLRRAKCETLQDVLNLGRSEVLSLWCSGEKRIKVLDDIFEKAGVGQEWMGMF